MTSAPPILPWADPVPSFVLACPLCAAHLDSALSCSACARDYSYHDGIYRFLLPERQEALQSFMSQYRLIRNSDGYRSRPAQYYRSLPDIDPRDPQAQTWRVRAETFEHLLRQLVRYFGPTPARSLAALGAPSKSAQGSSSGATSNSDEACARFSASLAVLDLGSGNGWLSNRLAALGHRCVAVDCSDDAEDGLGAFVHYSTPFTCVQADFDQLPFARHQFDVVIFNASLHYSPDVLATLHRANNLLLPGGALVVMDSPTFRSATSGQRMLAEQSAQLRAQSGMAQLAMLGVGYLTAETIITAGRQLGSDFQFTPSRGSFGWAMRRLLAGFKRRREPASFGLWHSRAERSLRQKDPDELAAR